MRPPLSLVAPLLRGHAIARHRVYPSGLAAWSSPRPSLSSMPADAPPARGLDIEGRRKAREWSIPWGTGPDGEPRALTRALRSLPGLQETSGGSGTIRVMSFNMLAQALACSEYFPYVQRGQLKQKKRMPRVMDEVSRYGADIICLQECDAFDAILDLLKARAAPQGAIFEGVYKSGEGKEHGLALFFDSQAFRLIDSGSCDFGPMLHHGVGSFALLEDIRPDLAPGAIAEGGPLDGGDSGKGINEARDSSSRCPKRLCVVTTHLYWHPEGESVRLAQAEMLLGRVKGFLEDHLGSGAASVPIVIAGDLNTLPGVGVYRMLAAGSCKHEPPENFWEKVGREGPEGSASCMGQDRLPAANARGHARDYRQEVEGLSSAYSSYRAVFGSQLTGQFPPGGESFCRTTRRRTIGHVQLGVRDGFAERQPAEWEPRTQELDRAWWCIDRLDDMASGEPELTSCTNGFAAAIDYIWHTPQLELRSLLELPSLEQAMQDGGLPSASYPSDHVSIVAELRWRARLSENHAQERGVAQE